MNTHKKKERSVVLAWLRRAAVIAVVATGLGLLVFAFAPRPLLVDGVRVTSGPMRVTVDEDGRARIKDRYVVSSPIGGRLGRIESRPGDEVLAGAVLARIAPVDPPLLDQRTRATSQAGLSVARAAKQQTSAQIERATANYEFAKRESQRADALYKDGAIALAALEDAKLAERTAKADLDSAEFGAKVALHEFEMAAAALDQRAIGDNFAQLEVTAPVGGRILNVLERDEGVIQPGTPLLELGDPGALEIVVDVLTRDAVRISPGAAVTIDTWGGERLAARVRRIDPSAFARVSALGLEEQRVNVIIDLEEPREKWAALGDGYRVEAHIVVWQSDVAITVPSSAVFRNSDGWALYRVVDGIAELTPIEIGQRSGPDTELVSGVSAGELVIRHPGDHIADGSSIEVR